MWENPKYISPAKLRQAYSKKAANKYERRVEKKVVYEATKPETGYPDIEGADFFKGDPMEKAEEVVVKGNYFNYAFLFSPCVVPLLDKWPVTDTFMTLI